MPDSKLLCFVRDSWRIAVAVLGAIAILAGFYSFTNTFAKAEDVKKAISDTNTLTDEKLKTIDMKTGQAIDNVNKSMQYQFLVNRYNTLKDQERSLKIMMKQNPKDRELQAELDKVLKEKEQLIIEQQKVIMK